MLIHHFLEHSAARFPDKEALIHGKGRNTYAEINSQANRLASWIHDQRWGQGERALLLMDNSLEYVVSYYGILKAGMVAVPVSIDATQDHVSRTIADVQPKLALTAGKYLDRFEQGHIEQHNLTIVVANPKQDMDESAQVFEWHSLLDSQSDPVANLELDIGKDDLASIIFTSGSTGKPKGVMLSHGNITANVRSICSYLELTENDIQMVVLPFFYVMGKSLLNTHFAVGGSVVINNTFFYPATVVKQMVQEKVTGFSGVPSTYAYLLHRSPLARYRDELLSLRYCSQAGGHMATQIKKDLRAALPGHTDIVIMYGATEAGARLSYLEPDQFEARMGSIGRAIPGVELKVVDDAGMEVAIGTRGELVARGENIMLGYWNEPEATSKAIDGHGFYHTGDTAYADQDGYLCLCGRKDNMLKVSGHKVNPQEVEECLMQTRQLVEAAVIGVEDSLSGHRLVALCVPQDHGLGNDDLSCHCQTHLPRYQVPAEFVFLKSLPKGSSGKVDARACLSLYKKRRASSS